MIKMIIIIIIIIVVILYVCGGFFARKKYVKMNFTSVFGVQCSHIVINKARTAAAVSVCTKFPDTFLCVCLCVLQVAQIPR